MKKISSSPPVTEAEAKIVDDVIRAGHHVLKPALLNVLPSLFDKAAAGGYLPDAGTRTYVLQNPSDNDSTEADRIRALVKTYKTAGYAIMGVTSDGTVIVNPSGKPDSFNMNQLDAALANLHTR